MKKTSVKIALTGFMASGKSSIATLLSDKLAEAFVEIDKEIEITAEKSVSEIFAIRGENAFRELESQTLARAISEEIPIISTGGGIIERPENIKNLKKAAYRLIYLSTPMSEIETRLKAPDEKASRPLAQDRDAMLNLFTRRVPLYSCLLYTSPSPRDS